MSVVPPCRASVFPSCGAAPSPGAHLLPSSGSSCLWANRLFLSVSSLHFPLNLTFPQPSTLAPLVLFDEPATAGGNTAGPSWQAFMASLSPSNTESIGLAQKLPRELRVCSGTSDLGPAKLSHAPRQVR